MANRRFEQFTYSLQKKLRLIYGYWILGASGAVASYGGNGVLVVSKLATGIYKIQLDDNYYYYLGAQFSIETPSSGANVSDGSFISGSLYQIQNVGNSNWHAYGVSSGNAPAVNLPFVAVSSGGAGTGVAKLISVSGSGLSSIEIAYDANTLTNWSDAITGTRGGSSAIVQTFASSGGPLALGSGLPGTKINFVLEFRDSVIST